MKLKRVKPGDPITAIMWNSLCDAIERQEITVTAPLAIQSGPQGTVLSLASGGDMRLAKTDGSGLTGRSGTTMGTGNINFYSSDSAGVLAAIGNTEVAKTFSATAIPANKYCLVVWVDGLWIVAAVEC